MKKVFSILLSVLLFFGCKDEESAEKKILDFKINSVPAIIEHTEKTVSIELPSGTDVTALSPEIDVSDKATVSPKSGEAQDFSTPVRYTVTAEDKTSDVYTVTVKVTRNEEAKITSFIFEELNPPAIGIINEAGKTISVDVSGTATLTALIPIIEISQGATINPVSGTVQDFSEPVAYTVTSELGNKETYTVQVNVIQSNYKQITSFVFASLDPEVTADIEEVSKTITADVPFGTDITNLVATLEISDGATISPGSGTPQDFTNPVEYTVTAENGSEATYSVSVTVLDFATRITGISTQQINPGNTLTINGNFAETGNVVTLEGVSVIVPIIVSQSASVIVITVPADAAEGNYSVSVTAQSIKYTHTTPLEIKLPDIVITSIIPTTTIVPGGAITITGNHFLASGNAVSFDGTAYNLSIISECETSITATLPANIDEGNYTLKVRSGSRSQTYGTSITVTDPTTARLTSLSKTTLVKGLDDLVITGENLVYGRLYFQRRGSTSTPYISIMPQEGTTITYTGSGLSANIFELGEYDVWFEISGKATNKLSFTLVENTNPIPVITGISSANPCIGTNVVITGSNFGEDATVRLDEGGGWVRNLTIVEKTSTQIIFSTDNLYTSDSYIAVEVTSGGQTDSYSVNFQAQYCTPEYISVSPAQAQNGDVVTITGNHFLTIGASFVYVNYGGVTNAYGRVVNNTTITFNVSKSATIGSTNIVVKNYYGNTEYFTVPSTDFEIIN